MPVWAAGAWAAGALALGSWEGVSGFVPGNCWANDTWQPGWRELSWANSQENGGELTASPATLTGVGVVGHTGAGDLSAQTPVVAGAGTTTQDTQGITGSGDLTAAAETLAGVGTRGSWDLPGDIELSAPAPAIAGAGTRGVLGETQAIASKKPSITGSGSVASGAGGVLGSGTLASSESFLSGAGKVGHHSTPALEGKTPTLVGDGYVGHTGTGALTASAAEVAGSGFSSGAAVVGALVVTPATLAGVGVVGRSAQPATLLGKTPTLTAAGVRGIVGIGALVVSRGHLRGYDPNWSSGEVLVRPSTVPEVRPRTRLRARKIRGG